MRSRPTNEDRIRRLESRVDALETLARRIEIPLEAKAAQAACPDLTPERKSASSYFDPMLDKAPPSPDRLVDALQDPIHKSSGVYRAAKAHREPIPPPTSGATGPAVMAAECECAKHEGRRTCDFCILLHKASPAACPGLSTRAQRCDCLHPHKATACDEDCLGTCDAATAGKQHKRNLPPDPNWCPNWVCANPAHRAPEAPPAAAQECDDPIFHDHPHNCAGPDTAHLFAAVTREEAMEALRELFKAHDEDAATFAHRVARISDAFRAGRAILSRYDAEGGTRG